MAESQLSEIVSQFLKDNHSLLTEEQAQEIFNYSQIVEENQLKFDFNYNDNEFPKLIIKLIIQFKEYENIISLLLQYTIIVMDFITMEEKINTFLKDENFFLELLNTCNYLLENYESLKFLVFIFINNLFNIKGNSPDNYKNNESLQREYITMEITNKISEIIKNQMLPNLDDKEYQNLLISSILFIFQSLQKRNKDFILFSDFDTCRNFIDLFLYYFNHLENSDPKSCLFFIDEVLSLQDDNFVIFLTNDLKIIIDINLREITNWAEVIHGEDDLKSNKVLMMYDIRLSYIKTLLLITKNNIYLENKNNLTHSYYKQFEIEEEMKKILNEKEIGTEPNLFFTLKEEALYALDYLLKL
ncbi:hypothetical protein ABK040_009399 [Willaertia magna]